MTHVANPADAFRDDLLRLARRIITSLCGRPGYGLLDPADQALLTQICQVGTEALEVAAVGAETVGADLVLEKMAQFLLRVTQNLYSRQLFQSLDIPELREAAYRETGNYMFPIAYGYFMRVGDAAASAQTEAQDCTQSALILVFTNHSRVRDPGRFLSWAGTVVLRECAHVRRKRRDVDPIADGASAGANANTGRNGEDADDEFERWLEIMLTTPFSSDVGWIDCLLKALGRLPRAGQRTVYVLQYLAGLMDDQIADLLQTSINNVQQLRATGKQLLRRDEEFLDCLHIVDPQPTLRGQGRGQ